MFIMKLFADRILKKGTSNANDGEELLKKYKFPFDKLKSLKSLRRKNPTKFEKSSDWHLIMVEFRNWHFTIMDLKDCKSISKSLYKKLLEAAKPYLDEYFETFCPQEGEITGYKKAWVIDFNSKSCTSEQVMAIVTLKIPEKAKRTSGYFSSYKKCRCDMAYVENIRVLKNGKYVKQVDSAYSNYDPSFKYVLGEKVKAKNYCEDRFEECSGGIHFFMSEEDAKCYYL